MPHLKIKPFSFNCGASPSALSMQTMQPMQPRLVLQQAVLRQPAVLLHARPAQPWLGQVHQPGQWNPARPMAMPVAMPVVKAVVKPVAKPSQWVYAAPLQSTPGHQKPNAGLPKLVSMKATTPQRKELPLIDGQVPRDAGVDGMHPVDFQTFWEQSLFKIFRFLSTCLVVPIGFTFIPGFQEILSCWFAHRKLWSSSVLLPQDCAFFGFLWCVQAEESAKYGCGRPAR